MKLKQILAKIGHREKPKDDLFLALRLEEDSIKGAAWSNQNEKIEVLATAGPEKWTNEEELFLATQSCLSAINQKLPPQNEATKPRKAVLGLPYHWINQDKISPEKGRLLKGLTKKLGLTPIGFVSNIEAVAHYLKVTEGIPPTAILVRLEEKQFTMAFFNLGQLIGCQKIERSGNLEPDFEEGFSRFNQKESFPGRMIIWGDQVDLEEIRQVIIGFSWTGSSVNFLHLPRVEILPAEVDIQSLAWAGNEEMLPVAKPVQTSASVPEEQTLGFVKNEDITKKVPVVPESLSIIEKPVKAKESFFAKIRWRPRLPAGWALRLFFLLLLVCLSGLIYWRLPKAQVILFVKSQALEKELNVKFDPQLKSKEREKMILPAETIEIFVSSEKTAAATGSKLIGDPAKGETTIYNATAKEKTFPLGTVITSASGVKFSLDEETTIASRSSAAEMSPSVVVKITAQKIGAEGNLIANTEFSLSNLAKSDFVAKNQSALTGGNSREVQVVSVEDEKKLLEVLTADLKETAREKLKAELKPQYRLIEESAVTQVAEKSFHPKQGEEASEITLKLKLKLTALSFSEDELNDLISEEIKSSIPDDFEYRPEKDEIEFKLEELDKKGVAVFSLRFKTKLVPRLDLEEIRKNLVGKRPSVGKVYLDGLSLVDSFEVKFEHRFPQFMMTFPRLIEHIKIEEVVQ